MDASAHVTATMPDNAAPAGADQQRIHHMGATLDSWTVHFDRPDSDGRDRQPDHDRVADEMIADLDRVVRRYHVLHPYLRLGGSVTDVADATSTWVDRERELRGELLAFMATGQINAWNAYLDHVTTEIAAPLRIVQAPPLAPIEQTGQCMDPACAYAPTLHYVGYSNCSYGMDGRRRTGP